jgi:hypothetical protein
MTYVAQIALFSITVWLALYLLARDARSLSLLLPGLGLLLFSLSIGVGLLAGSIGSQAFSGTATTNASTNASTNAAADWILALEQVAWLLIVLSLLPVAGVVPLLVRLHPRRAAPPVPSVPVRSDRGVSRGLHVRLAVASALLYLLLAILLLAWPRWPARDWLLAAMGAWLVLIGVIIAADDATFKVEAFLPDIGRSFDYSMVLALLFGGQVGSPGAFEQAHMRSSCV